ncbi:hypothetical protein L596_018348 [Steinernema carpocapsae]|uniref:Ig-like domain-containing protein n=1 Tax=Steinernema carpocapsae TaxID=34508 RepID=A0A4U5N4U1_STECR|nr:hypothetical protein L596_018348 [Steinernema carpocapsae]
MLFRFLALLAISVNLGFAGICKSTCQRVDECEIWLESDFSRDKSGVYSMSENGVDISCSFLSLSQSVNIEWQFKGRRDRDWRVSPCDEFAIVTEKCEVNDNFEHNFTKTCTVQLNNLSNSGIYRCKAINEYEKSAVSAETSLHVHGIESLKVIDSGLRYGHPGFIEAEVCANPMPRVHWMSRHHIVGDSHSQGPYAASALKHSRPNRTYSADYSDYCYRNRLIIAHVGHHEAHLSLMVTTEGDSKQMALKDHVPVHGLLKHTKGTTGVSLTSLCVLVVACLLF